MVLNNKTIQYVMSAGFNQRYGGFEATAYVLLANEVLQKYPVDMLIFEMKKEGVLQIRLAGYDLITNKLNEKTIALTTQSLPIDTFWLKIDDQGNYYTGTFLFPDEY